MQQMLLQNYLTVIDSEEQCAEISMLIVHMT